VIAALARSGRYMLPGGLAVGLLSPALADAMRPTIGPVVVILLFLAVLRIGPEGLRIGRSGLVHAGLRALVLQLALPLAVALPLVALGLLDGSFALGAVLFLCAAPLTGAAHFAVMAGGDPAPALRQTVIGTVLLPITVVPVFALAPAFGGASEVIAAVLRLLAVIVAAGGLALWLRSRGIVRGTAQVMTAIDAIAAVLLAAVVIGIMSAVGQTLRDDPWAFCRAMAFVCAIGFGLQALAVLIVRDGPDRPALAVVAGNRNVALFLGVLPAGVTDDLLLLIGCFQVPMYLTPLFLPRLIALRDRWVRP
jgi:hypothetical protein